MKKYKVTQDSGETIHFDSPLIEYALCGDVLEFDDLEGSAIPTREAVTCQQCWDVVNHVRGKNIK